MRAGFAAAGVAVPAGPGAGCDVAFVPAGRRSPLPTDAEVIVLAGRLDGPRLRRRGYTSERFLVLPALDRPALAVPLDAPRVARYALEHWVFPRGRYRRLRRRAARAFAERGALPPLARGLAVAQRKPAPPFFVAAARELGLPAKLAYFARWPEGDALARGTFFLFAEDAATPGWILKFARVPGYDEPFRRDERGLAVAAEAGIVAEGRAPSLVGRLEVAGLHAAVETAATGSPLGDLLATDRPLAQHLADVERVAEWIVEVGARTLQPDGIDASARERLVDAAAGLPGADRVDALLRSTPAVVDHNDLGPWNVIASGDTFVVVDWESARRTAPPLWDLWYFLTEAAAAIERIPRDDRGAYVVRLFRGDSPLSSLLFRWTARAVDALGLRADAVGLLAMLCWAHHAQSHAARERSLGRHGEAAGDALFRREFPAGWATDQALGAGWTRWQS